VSLSPEREELDLLAETFADEFGRDAVVDLLREELVESHGQRGGERQFFDHLKRALYASTDAPCRSIHYEFAAMLHEIGRSRFVRLYTLNYDGLIERGVRELTSHDPRPAYSGKPQSPRNVVHLHGYFPSTEERPLGDLILSEKDYLESSNDWADDQIRALFNRGRDVLLVGMSLDDSRLRRLLHQRQKTGHGKGSTVFALLSGSTGGRHLAPLERRARQIATQYQTRFWDSWNVEASYLPSHDLVPYALHVIRRGTDSADWADRGRDFLKTHDVYEDLYDPHNQALTSLYLESQLAFIRARLETKAHEELTIGAFVPADTPGKPQSIELAFRYSDGVEGRDFVTMLDTSDLNEALRSEFNITGDRKPVQLLSRSQAKERQLSISPIDKPEGVAGFAFVRGTVLSVDEESNRMNANFSATKRSDWNRKRAFSSLYCVPVFDSTSWVAVGVIYLASTLTEPMWAGLNRARRLQLNSVLRSTFRNAIDYDSALN
jgi:hypothetical protein